MANQHQNPASEHPTGVTNVKKWDFQRKYDLKVFNLLFGYILLNINLCKICLIEFSVL